MEQGGLPQLKGQLPLRTSRRVTEASWKEATPSLGFPLRTERLCLVSKPASPRLWEDAESLPCVTRAQAVGSGPQLGFGTHQGSPGLVLHLGSTAGLSTSQWPCVHAGGPEPGECSTHCTRSALGSVFGGPPDRTPACSSCRDFSLVLVAMLQRPSANPLTHEDFPGPAGILFPRGPGGWWPAERA